MFTERLLKPKLTQYVRFQSKGQVSGSLSKISQKNQHETIEPCNTLPKKTKIPRASNQIISVKDTFGVKVLQKYFRLFTCLVMHLIRSEMT